MNIAANVRNNKHLPETAERTTLDQAGNDFLLAPPGVELCNIQRADKTCAGKLTPSGWHPSMNLRLGMRLEWYRQALANHGITSLVRLQLQKRLPARSRLQKLTSKQLRYPVHARRGTSDLFVFEQILTAREYRCLDSLKGPRLIIDCGANVGYSSAYFLSKFPHSFVIAVEPDPDNFAMLERNLLPYSGRYKAIRAAVWPHHEPLRIKAETNSTGQEWGRTVEPNGAPTSDGIDAIDIQSIIALSGFDRVSVLKIDIEGAETGLFRARPDRWLDQIENIVIELHGEDARQAFFEALPFGRYGISTCDELTVCLSRDFRSRRGSCPMD